MDRAGDQAQRLANDDFQMPRSTSMTDHADFSVVVKNRASPPKSWIWEIYRAGRSSPIKQSDVYFVSMTEADRAGKTALRLLLGEHQN
jgi:hypothetical protein